MKKIFALTAAVAMSIAAGASAQNTTQAAVLGETGNPNYPIRVQGGNGQIYSCKAEIETIDGVRARRCVQDDDGALYAAGAALAQARLLQPVHCCLSFWQPATATTTQQPPRQPATDS
ncbi:hypothetical protein ACFQFQ_09655 [Sulfitobacter porphyrae]|uniref:Uncharacterized protein n=1 Tax=Sulfitobacter porphyrae TaxID=1246864 RepID=A0ABW2B255_9RHOB